MLCLGLLDEADKLYKRKDLRPELPSVRMVGYRQIWQYLAGQISYNQMLEQIPIATRQLAKRQMTWIRSWPEVKCFDSESTQLLVDVTMAIKRFL